MHIDGEKHLLANCMKYLIRISQYYANSTITIITLELCKDVESCTDSFECIALLNIKHLHLKRLVKAHIVTEYAMQWYSIMIDGMMYVLKQSTTKQSDKCLNGLLKGLTDNPLSDSECPEFIGETQNFQKPFDTDFQQKKSILNSMYGVGVNSEHPENSEEVDDGE